jgi:signal transduction histidine kinase
VELSVTSHDNTKLDLEVALTTIEHRKQFAVQGIVRDITTRKKLERLKSNFLAMAAHELRTALTLITGYNKLLLRKETGPLSATQRKIIKGCQHSCDRLTDFVNDILELSKLGAGRMTLNLQAAEINQCIRNVVDELSILAREKNILLEEKTPPKAVAKTVSMDPNKIEQVLINLTRNAIQHSPEGGKVEIEVLRHSDGVIAVCISDNGVGVPEEEREIIFDEFTIGKNAHGTEGMGLGLAICKKIIELHDGRIWVEPNNDGGSRFIFCLPLSQE